jgi:hypothetical protein
MFKKLLLPFLFFLSAGASLLPGCKPREEELQTTGSLAFSVDTVKFDTVFTSLRTVTKRLWVYNRNPRAVNVDLISLDNSATSPYTLIINGDQRQTASGIYIRGNDSLLILVRALLGNYRCGFYRSGRRCQSCPYGWPLRPRFSWPARFRRCASATRPAPCRSF